MGSKDVDEVDADLATAVGLVALSDGPVHEAADAAGVTRWELEDAIDAAGLAAPLGLDGDTDITEEIDEVLEKYS